MRRWRVTSVPGRALARRNSSTNCPISHSPRPRRLIREAVRDGGGPPRPPPAGLGAVDLPSGRLMACDSQRSGAWDEDRLGAGVALLHLAITALDLLHQSP